MKHILAYFILILCCTGCFLVIDELPQTTRPAITIASITPDPTIPVSVGTPMALPNGVFNALPSTMGICFEAAWDAAGQVFVLRSANEHIRFYDLADNSNLCSRPVRREPFDFASGDVLVGIWNRGFGCTAQHMITQFERNDSAKTINIRTQFSTDGDCPYELVRGLWLGIQSAQDYTITLTVE